MSDNPEEDVLPTTSTSEPTIPVREEQPSSTSEPASASGSVKSFGIARPSGIKQPSKIGRLCSHSAPKPAIPTTPRSDGSTFYGDNQPKHSDEYSRKYLAASSTASGNSMEALWENHPRRLSEAGLRRSSDHSVVLTEDTDSFIIGDRVWVGGSKPGQIAYIGETQFAPGEWAGIVLDDPIGKNDGSVAGVRYFQCSEKRGVFSRLTRLTRAPIFTHAASPSSEAGSSVFGSRPTTANGSRRSPAPVPSKTRRAHSPNGSIRSAVSSKMNQSITSSHYSSGEVKVGERVIVSSSQGSKAGTLRYMGPTEFAQGNWCGVELDDPIGKNDGSVEGKRYFECAPRFGLFAPLAKVSRSPSSRRPGQCVVHSTPLRRSNSRDSLTSFSTSIASTRPASRLNAQRLTATPRNASSTVTAKNALQELLREKQQHLERLMQERELERAEVVKFTLQAERAESALSQARNENNLTVKENKTLKAELDVIKKKLEDEKQKVDDLLFRSEEDNIHKEEFNKLKDSLEAEKQQCEKKILDLETSVSVLEEAVNVARAALNRADSAHALELETLRAQHNEEVLAGQVLSSELQKLLDEAYALLKEKEDEKDSLNKSMHEEVNRLKMELEKAQNEAKSKVAVLQTEFDAQMTVLNAKLQAAEAKLALEKQNSEKIGNENSSRVSELSAKVTQLQASHDDKVHELNKVMGAAKEQELSLNKEISKLKMELSAKINDLEESLHISQKQNQTVEQLQNEMRNMKEDFEKKIKDYEVLLNETSKQNDTISEELLDLKSKLGAKTSELDKYLNESQDQTKITEKLVNEYKDIIHDRDKEIIKLQESLSAINANQSLSSESYKKDLDEKNSKIQELDQIISKHVEELEKAKMEFESISATVKKNLEDNDTITAENKELKEKVHNLIKSNEELKENLVALELKLSEANRSVIDSNEKYNELEKSKEKLENDINIINSNSNSSSEQLQNLTQTLRETEKELLELKNKNRETNNAHEKVEHDLNLQISKLSKKLEDEKKIKDHIISDMKIAAEKYCKQKNRVTNLETALSRTEEASTIFEKENDLLKTQLLDSKSQANDLETKLAEAKQQHSKEIETLQRELEILRSEGNLSEIKLQEKVDQLVEAQNDLNYKLEQARSNEEQLQKTIEDITVNMIEERKLSDTKLQFSECEILKLNEALTKFQNENSTHASTLNEKDTALKELNLKLNMMEVDLQTNLSVIVEKERQLDVALEELKKKNDEKIATEKKLNISESEITSLKHRLEAISAEKGGNDTVLNNQKEQIQNLVQELNILKSEKEKLSSDNCEFKESLNKAIHDHEVARLEQESLRKNAQKLETGLTDTQNLLQSEIGMRKDLENYCEMFKEKNDELEKQLQSKTEVLLQLEKEVKVLKESSTTESSELTSQLDNIRKELENTKISHKDEIDNLNKTIESLNLTSKELENKSEQLNHSSAMISELKTLLAKNEEDIKQLTKINEGQKSNYEDLNSKLQTEYDNLKKDSKKDRHALKERLRDKENLLKEINDKLESKISTEQKLAEKLAQSESKILELENKNEILSLTEKGASEKDTVLEKITSELQSVKSSNLEQVKLNKEQSNLLKSELESKKIELQKKNELITNLQNEILNQKAKTEIAEREKVLMQKELTSIKNNPDMAKDKENNPQSIERHGDHKENKLAEERDMIDSQVSFLNSVIVDMQRKNEQLLARVQALESGFSPDDVNEFQFNGTKSSRTLPPRLYCDICEIFDAHDTEDCPRQRATTPPSPKKEKKAKPPQRPYCDICEVFGHATEECDEEETF